MQHVRQQRYGLEQVAIPGSLELPTFSLGNRCSLQLSHGLAGGLDIRGARRDPPQGGGVATAIPPISSAPRLLDRSSYGILRQGRQILPAPKLSSRPVPVTRQWPAPASLRREEMAMSATAPRDFWDRMHAEPSDEANPVVKIRRRDDRSAHVPPRRRRPLRALFRFLLAVGIGVGGILAWQAFGDMAREMAATAYPQQLGWLRPLTPPAQTVAATVPGARRSRHDRLRGACCYPRSTAARRRLAQSRGRKPKRRGARRSVRVQPATDGRRHRAATGLRAGHPRQARGATAATGAATCAATQARAACARARRSASSTLTAEMACASRFCASGPTRDARLRKLLRTGSVILMGEEIR